MIPQRSGVILAFGGPCDRSAWLRDYELGEPDEIDGLPHQYRYPHRTVFVSVQPCANLQRDNCQ